VYISHSRQILQPANSFLAVPNHPLSSPAASISTWINR
jgi:hypothetical protein